MAKLPPTTPLPAVRPLPMALVAARVVAELQAKPTDVVVRRIDAKRARFSGGSEPVTRMPGTGLTSLVHSALGGAM